MNAADKTAILIISAIVIFGFGGVLLAWMVIPPKGNANVLSLMTGALCSGYGTVLGYWFRQGGTNGP